MTTQLEAAEQELYEWATGERSCISEMLNIEGNREDRTKTLALVEARDADAIRAAREKVLALRLLASGVLGVNADTIRAEALEDAAHLAIGTPGFNALRARAAEYRKAAGA